MYNDIYKAFTASEKGERRIITMHPDYEPINPLDHFWDINSEPLLFMPYKNCLLGHTTEDLRFAIRECWSYRSTWEKKNIDMPKGGTRRNELYLDFHCERDLVEAAHRTDALIMPIYLYEHGGMVIRLNEPYPCRWDSCQAGILFWSKEQRARYYGRPDNFRDTTKRIQEDEKRAKELFQPYATYVCGDCYVLRSFESPKALQQKQVLELYDGLTYSDTGNSSLVEEIFSLDAGTLKEINPKRIH